MTDAEDTSAHHGHGDQDPVTGLYDWYEDVKPAQATVLQLQPGDIVVLRVEDGLSLDDVARIKKMCFPDNNVITLLPGQDIEIIRPTQD